MTNTQSIYTGSIKLWAYFSRCPRS